MDDIQIAMRDNLDGNIVGRRVPFQSVITDIVGYTGDADLWCPPCARLAFDRRIDGILRTVRQRARSTTKATR